MKTKLIPIMASAIIGLLNQTHGQSSTNEASIAEKEFLKTQNHPALRINEGSGYFERMGGLGHQEDTIRVYYHKPKNFTAQSKILLVIPGSGRNGDDYRDSWIEASEKHSVLIISPSYAEKNYGYGDYHLGGIVSNLNILESVTFKENSNIVELNEEKVKYELNLTPGEWIYDDFDRLFEEVAIAVGSSQTAYDIFGHSAGGQILHRFALFAPHSKANRILASNSGSYTPPDSTEDFPFGIKNIGLQEENLKQSFRKKLVLFLGELDNENETGGLMLRSPTVDKQGTHRLQRGKYFYWKSQETAKTMNATFNWRLQIIPDVGHNQKKMAGAAAIYLYE
ncbi:hypothetical protein [Eudoraea chungangensis]|uniref:hypothetical protein n=1 Tax=Eudoraea chungangensis TaxID=1481905 RepID=UPI0023ED8D3E|nr:hypothetical protein [Eudoraea chungangensis]